MGHPHRREPGARLARKWGEVALAAAGIDVPPASGGAQIRRILDALAAIPDTIAKPLAEVLACPHCRSFRDGLQLIVTTDRAHSAGGCRVCATEDQRLVVLTAAAFADDAVAADVCRHDLHQPWLRIDSPEEIPMLLRGGWREARHGS